MPATHLEDWNTRVDLWADSPHYKEFRLTITIRKVKVVVGPPSFSIDNVLLDVIDSFPYPGVKLPDLMLKNALELQMLQC